MRKPERAFMRRYGALVIDSMPPATTISASPHWIMRSAMCRACRLERHALLIVVELTVIGIPALAAAWRAVTWPPPAWMTWPMRTRSTMSGETPARSSAPLMAKPPRSWALSGESAPENFPMGVRDPATMTLLDMDAPCVGFGCADFRRAEFGSAFRRVMSALGPQGSILS